MHMKVRPVGTACHCQLLSLQEVHDVSDTNSAPLRAIETSTNQAAALRETERLTERENERVKKYISHLILAANIHRGQL